jgi:Cellulase (glycosyl hydrolase family 5)
MKNISRYLLVAIFLFSCPNNTIAKSPDNKFGLWKKPGFFRGFNAGYWSSHDDYAKTIKDFRAIKEIGANLIKINIYGGTVSWKSPYKNNREAIGWLDQMMTMARKAKLFYIIDVRAGPGRMDVSEEHKHTIWTNKTEQKKYAEMLKEYVKKYGKDPFFVGLNLMVEPNPLWEEIENNDVETPAALKKALKKQGIDIHGMFKYFIGEIRSVNKTLPLIVQNIQYSDPQWWGLMQKYDDPYIVYDVHSYVPFGYTHAGSSYKKKYPGKYWCMALDKFTLFNKTLLDSVIFKHVKRFQQAHKVPVLLGEFGMQFPQEGGAQYLSDCVDIAKKQGWHFCLWSFRSNNPESEKHIDFDPEKWKKPYWNEVKSWF